MQIPFEKNSFPDFFVGFLGEDSECLVESGVNS